MVQALPMFLQTLVQRRARVERLKELNVATVPGGAEEGRHVPVAARKRSSLLTFSPEKMRRYRPENPGVVLDGLVDVFYQRIQI